MSNKTGIQNSNLNEKINGKDAYDVDMVTAVSEKAINSQLRAYMTKTDWQARAYILSTIDDDGRTVEFLLQEFTDENAIPEIFELKDVVDELRANNSSLYKEIDGMNLFDIPTGTASSNEEYADVLQKAINYSVGYGVRLTAGIPDKVMRYYIQNEDTVNIDESLKIITLVENNKSVVYKQIFKDFEVFQMNVKISKRGITAVIMNAKQDCPNDDPVKGLWTATSSINICLKDAKFNNLYSEDVKKTIAAMAKVPNPDTVFDISQLMLDLSTLQTVEPVVIDGVPMEVRQTVTAVVNTYLEKLEKAGQTVFGHVVVPNSKNSINYLFRPVSRDFGICGHELQYLMNFDDSHNYNVPSLLNQRNFSWAPILSDVDCVDGAMAIKSTKYIPLIRNSIKPVLDELVKTKHPYVTTGAYKYELHCVDGDKDATPEIKVDVAEPWKCTWDFEKGYSQGWQCIWAPPLPFPVASSKIESNYKVHCDGAPGTALIGGVVYPSYNFDFIVTGWMNFGYNSQDNTGDYYQCKLSLKVAIKIDGNGQIKLLTVTNCEEQSVSGIKIHAWGKFCTFGQLNGLVDSMKNSLTESVKKALENASNEFTKGYDTFAAWFLPGSRTFTFKNEGISTCGDFFTSVNYVQE